MIAHSYVQGKAGVQGNFYYIIDKNPGFQAGLYLGAGYAH
jgi:hypothetical protein